MPLRYTHSTIKVSFGRRLNAEVDQSCNANQGHKEKLILTTANYIHIICITYTLLQNTFLNFNLRAAQLKALRNHRKGEEEEEPF